MGFDVTAANVIFFVAALSIGSVALGAYWHNAGYIEEAQRGAEDRAAARAHTNMSVQSASYNPGLDRFRLTLANTGSEVITVSGLRYFVDGVYVSGATIERVEVLGAGSTDLWLPMEVLELDLRPIDPSPTHFQVVAANGVKANWRS
ncbi:MAG TPA: hypothetical protein VM582_05440 [Candidatus Thermoplasmatota archaeon]|nr:hypothetical protein [Candidatus Thermoplasmatota archaeon]